MNKDLKYWKDTLIEVKKLQRVYEGRVNYWQAQLGLADTTVRTLRCKGMILLNKKHVARVKSKIIAANDKIREYERE